MYLPPGQARPESLGGTMNYRTVQYIDKAASDLGDLLRVVRPDALTGAAMDARKIVLAVLENLDPHTDHLYLADAIAQAIVVGGIPVGTLPTDPEPTGTDPEPGCCTADVGIDRLTTGGWLVACHRCGWAEAVESNDEAQNAALRHLTTAPEPTPDPAPALRTMGEILTGANMRSTQPWRV